jgi:Polyketide cyclase / dehydrase and lipid transport
MNATQARSTRSTREVNTMPKPSTRWWLRTDSAEVVVAASAEHLYGLVSDLPRMGEWSPECTAVEWTGDSAVAQVGATFVGHNRTGPRGMVKWSRTGTVRAASPGREFAFATSEGGREGVLWRYELEAIPEGTLVRESYRVEWIPAWARIGDVLTNRARELRQSMQQTLARLKAAAESPSVAR